MGLRAAIGSISVLAAVFAGLQALLKFPERAERHGPREALGQIRKEINKIVQNAPEIGEAVWRTCAAKYGAKEPL